MAELSFWKKKVFLRRRMLLLSGAVLLAYGARFN